MLNQLRRYYGQGDLHFITFSCCRRQPLLGSRRARDRFLEILDEVRSHCKFLLLGYVIMPEHVHLLVSEPAKSDLFQGLAGTQTESLARPTRPAKRVRAGSVVTGFSAIGDGCAGILATALLRF